MEPFIGEIRLFAGNFAPLGWQFCDGALLSVSTNEALFFLIGTSYGGDGQTTFAVPDLRGRVPQHVGSSSMIGQSGGVEQVTLFAAQIPSHPHVLSGSSQLATTTKPLAAVPAKVAEATARAYGTDNPATTMAPQTLTHAGSSQPHDNVQPFLCINFIISLEGIFPSQN